MNLRRFRIWSFKVFGTLGGTLGGALGETLGGTLGGASLREKRRRERENEEAASKVIVGFSDVHASM